MWWSSLPPSSTLPARDATGSVLNAPSAGQVLTLYWVCSCCVRSVAVRAAGDTIACPYRSETDRPSHRHTQRVDRLEDEQQKPLDQEGN